MTGTTPGPEPEPGPAPGPAAGSAPDPGPRPAAGPESPEHLRARQAREKRDERQMWMWLAYFLFGIHVVALVMIYAVRHAK